MEINVQDTVGNIAARVPQAAAVFEALHLDYCCNGARRLRDACDDAGLRPEDVVARIVDAQRVPTKALVDWSAAGASALIRHLVDTHHVYTRDSFERLGALMAKVLARHGDAHPGLAQIASALGALREELIPHLSREEAVLFPYIREVEARRAASKPLGPVPFGSVRNPIQAMNREHEGAGRILAELEARTSGYRPPPEACASWRALYEGMRALQLDLHMHIHLESNVLFPMALRLELGGADLV